MLFCKLLGVGGAAFTGYLLSELAFPRNYAATFFIGFIVLMLGLVCFAFTIEPERVVPEVKNTPVQNGRKVWQILSKDIPFRNFLISRFLAFMGYMAFGLFAVYGIAKFDLPAAYAATFTAVLIAGNMVGYTVFGEIGDRVGNKVVFAASDVLMGGALVFAMFSDSIFSLLAVFALVGIAQSGAVIADMNMVMEFSLPQDRPTYMGIFKTMTGPAFLLAPLIGGGLVEILGYKPMFLVSFLIVVVGFLVLVILVPEPRNNSPNSELPG